MSAKRREDQTCDHRARGGSDAGDPHEAGRPSQSPAAQTADGTDRRPPPHAPDSGHHEVASDGGGEHWAVIASLVETCKLNAVDPQVYLGDVITRIVTGHPQSQIDELLPWAYAPHPLRAVA